MKNKTYITTYLRKLRKLAALALLALRADTAPARHSAHASMALCTRLLAVFTLLSSLFTSCSDDYTMENADLQTEQALSTAAGFSVKPTNESTRLTYDDLSTTFSNGDSVGCIICTMTSSTDDSGNTTYSYDFVANSLWTYIEDSVAFVIKKYWQVPSTDDTSSDDSNTTTLTLVEPAENSSSYLISYSGAKTLINSSDNLYLFFYYPFIDPEESTLQNVPSYTTTNDDETTSTTYLCGPPSAYTNDNSTTLYSYPATESKTTLTLTPYSWRNWPLFVNSCTSTVSNSMGDWMDARYLYGVNNTTTGNINIQFKHRTAAICINAATDISNVKIVLADGSGESGDTGNTGGSGSTETTQTTTTTPDSIKIGQLIDLASGKLKDFDTSSTSTPDQYAYLTQSSDTLYPYKIDAQNYRFYLPAQDNWAGRLIYSYDYEDSTSIVTTNTDETTTSDTTVIYKLRALSLDSLGKGSLEANTKYDVAVPWTYNTYTQYLYFTGTSTPSSNYAESDSGFFTVGTRDTLSTSCTTPPYSLQKSGIVTNMSKFTYAIKFQNQSNKGEYVGFEVPSTAGPLTLAVYLAGYQTSSGEINKISSSKLSIVQLPTGFDFTKNVSASKDQTYEETTYTAETHTAEETTDEGGTKIFLLTTTLQAGYKYMIYYSSGTSHAYLIVLTNNTSIL